MFIFYLLGSLVAFINFYLSSSFHPNSIHTIKLKQKIKSLKVTNKDLSQEDKELIANKLKEWSKLKEMGILSQMKPNLFEEDIAEFEILADNALGKRKSLAGKLLARENERARKGIIEKDIAIEGEDGRIYKDFLNKIEISKSSEQKLLDLLLELKDKDFVTNMLSDIIGKILNISSRMAASSHTDKIMQFAINLQQNGDILLDRKFWSCILRNVYLNKKYSVASKLSQDFLNADLLNVDDSKLAKLLGDLQSLGSIKDKSSVSIEELDINLQETFALLSKHTVEGLNDLMRVLGKLGLFNKCFSLYETMKTSKSPQLRPTSETLEHLINAIITPAISEERATTMKDLPRASIDIPEVILLGRSNVGKSSLTNFLLNRKNLASVSPTPGHTQAFHFFTIQRREAISLSGLASLKGSKEGTKEPKQFRMIDIPGLGYAETVDENRQQSWKSLLMRYLSVRDNCCQVLHLIDSRHPLSATDKEIIELVAQASLERTTSDKKSFNYSVILTKTDKLGSKESSTLIPKIKEEISVSWPDSQAATLADQIDILPTSTLKKSGAELVWSRILKSL